MSHSKNLIFWLISILSFSGCISAAFLPAESDLQFVSNEGQSVEIQDLQEGFLIYKTHCAGCHSLYKPQQFTKQQWVKYVPQMSERAKMDSINEQKVLLYLKSKSSDR